VQQNKQNEMDSGDETSDNDDGIYSKSEFSKEKDLKLEEDLSEKEEESNEDNEEVIYLEQYFKNFTLNSG
jgi:hypothetical protein